jgi:hypothetical protein
VNTPKWQTPLTWADIYLAAGRAFLTNTPHRADQDDLVLHGQVEILIADRGRIISFTGPAAMGGALLRCRPATCEAAATSDCRDPRVIRGFWET